MDMDASLTIKPRDAVARSVRTSVARTEVAPTQSVTPPPPVDHSHQPAAAQDSVGRDLVDPQGRDVIYREREERERQRRRRPPDEALMRQRAYGQATHPSSPSPRDEEPDSHADIQI
jgi:hypothetical protein